MFPLFKPSSSCTLLYVHLPFCTTICPFCSFAVRRDRASAHQPYINTLLQELILSLDEENPEHLPLKAIYFGGGTPSRLTVSELEWLLRGIHRRWEFSPEVEITLECNPEDVTRETLQGWLAAGFNRFSIGGQSFQDPLLKKLGRVHNAAQLRSGLDCFHQENVGNWNLDLMFGIPGQTMEDFSQDLEESLENEPNHLSLYGLEIHP
ncbi:MAG: radical SAM protein, partial [SAR324 cluster bacterium]|nr:radical SAM protein [SAR324 cluster bacterium]